MKIKAVLSIIILLSTHALANEKSIHINEQIAKQMFIGAADNRFALLNNEQPNYQHLIASLGQQYLWFDNNKLNLSGLSLVSLLNDLGIKGLPFEIIDSSINFSEADQQLSQQLFYIANLFNGYQLKPVENPTKEIIQAVKNNNLASYVDQLLPQFDQVVRLRSAIAYYRQLSKSTWPRLDKKLSFTLGQGHQEIVKVRQMLSALGDLEKGHYSRYRQHIFDPEIIIALKKFQARHGLKTNGKLNAQTISALNITPEKRIKIMQINLWRWLSLPSIPPQRYVIVNIPSYQLSLIESQQESLTMKVIVGDIEHPTPIMVTQVNSVTINPTWTPTYNIVHKELLPENTSNPGSLRRQNFKLTKGYGNKRIFQPVFDDSGSILKALGNYQLVQASGKNNALGKYRFNIKNFHSVYLHDTPAKNLFNKTNRALSHGCVRLQSADKLAKHFLVMQEGSQQGLAKKQQVNKAIHSTNTQHFALAQSIPVYLTYQTVLVTAAGKLQWQTDIYQLDAKTP
ncbi:L,D-transpeptidase family protein [Colwellia sp. BRX10-3]|uniref:L,D-transpeptidase family protein n=1 Tax=Colwellia sp. BRX10-3 TaxID=2759844 RepID=UPI0015F3CE8B|nr:L,D-transpeptidase family protein [Colwellia sp. BRX10-3]MBA6390716.1 L,D-transpeptidase family protein [Colwellia sp. BRX10-3]